MNKQLGGIHHVTAIADDPQRNVDFYTGVLGLRMVKLTVNFDDPQAYHLYFGDEIGRPGTVMTFFTWPGARRGVPGNGQVSTVSFTVPDRSTGYWLRRFEEHGVAFQNPVRRFDEEVISFADPDGLQLELVTAEGTEAQSPWKDSPVPREHAIGGFLGVTLAEEGYERTAELLTGTLGFRLVGQSGSRYRFEVGNGGPGGTVDVLCAPDATLGRVAVGTVHHVAYRTPDDEEQVDWRSDLVEADYNVTPVIDRLYFRSIYFREPGGVLFEIATDQPGFAIDEPPDQLGRRLTLPPWLEPQRIRLERALPKVRLPEAVGSR